MKLRSVLLSFLALTMVFIAACSSGNNKNTASPSASPAESSPAASSPAAVEPDKTHKITGITFLFGNPPPNTGDGLKAINERFNVDYFVEKVPQESYTEKLTAVISSGSMPDMIGFKADDKNFHRWAKQGAFLPLNDYIAQYPTLAAIPEELFLPFTIDGKIYAIPTWSPVEASSYIIRKDWLDNLGLPIPTTYEEFAEVLIAFTKNDPDGNKKNDTYGLAMGENINPNYAQGPYWQFDTWYHKDANGNYIPGIISEGRKELIEMFNLLYKEKALTPDFALMKWADTNTEFYSGKAGVFLMAPRGMSQDYMTSLLAIDPKAEFAVLPPFKAPDGSEGFVAGRGFSRYHALNANLSKDTDKLNKILEMHDFSRKHYTLADQTPSNEDFDWFNGKNGVGYEKKDGATVLIGNEEGKQPFLYFQDSTSWISEGINPEFEKAYTEPKLIQATLDLMEINKQSKLYFSPHTGIVSETEGKSGAELTQYLMAEQTKMISGQRPIADWDAMVNEYLTRGGSKIIEEYNAGIKERGYTDHVWK